jgi:hypothetical protein
LRPKLSARREVPEEEERRDALKFFNIQKNSTTLTTKREFLTGWPDACVYLLKIDLTLKLNTKNLHKN